MKRCIELSTLARCTDPYHWPSLPLTTLAVAYNGNLLQEGAVTHAFPNDLALEKLAAYYFDSKWTKNRDHSVWADEITPALKLCTSTCTHHTPGN